MPNRSQKANFLILYISIILCFLGAELFLRSNHRFYSEGYRPSKNDRLIYELEPDYFIKSTGSRISSQGLADRYYSLKKPTGTYRIAVVGDSTSFGLHVGHSKSLPKFLESKLNEHFSIKHEVLNFSVPGYNIAQEYELIKEKVLEFDPDMVITVFDNNDIHMCNYLKPKSTLLNFLNNKSFVIHYLVRQINLLPDSYKSFKGEGMSPVWIFVKKNILNMFYYEQRIYKRPGLEEAVYINGDPPLNKDNVPRKYWHMLGLDNYRIHLSRINSLLKNRNITFISSGFFENSPNELKINKEIGVKSICDFDRYLKRDGLNFIDVEHELGHLSVKGHSLAAQYLFEIITSINHI